MGEKKPVVQRQKQSSPGKRTSVAGEMRPEREEGERESQSHICGSYRFGKELGFYLGSHWRVIRRKRCDWIYAKNKQTITVLAE